MKKIEWAVYIIAWVFVIWLWVYGYYAKKDFKTSEYERGSMFAVDWNYKYHDYPSYWAREKAFYYPELSMDSIFKVSDSLIKAQWK